MKRLPASEEPIAKKYSGMIEEALEKKLGKGVAAGKTEAAKPRQQRPILSSNYIDFKRENLPRHLSFYEKLCNRAERILPIKPDAKKAAEIQEYISLCHLESTPAGAMSLAVIAAVVVTLLGGVLGFLVVKSMLVTAYALGMGLFTFAALIKAPEFLANNFRLAASNQMVQCIFYVATFMRHTSNLELAVRFSADRLTPPLALDLKKILWDVETGRYDTIKDSLDNYLETWRKWNLEFIESFHLIEGSLYEPSDERRLNMIDKSLDVMLQETYEKMLRYSHDLKSPVTMLYMLGIVLPVLGLVILPMAASFLTSDTPPMKLAFNIALLYNIILPLILFYMSKMVLSKRPTGYGEQDISEVNAGVRQLRNIILKFGGKTVIINPLWLTIGIMSFMILIGLVPVLLGAIIPDEVLLQERTFDQALGFKLLDYKQTGTGIIGPYGLVATVLSFFIPLGLGIGLGIYYRIRSRNVLKLSEEAKALEEEFSSALFQLGNRIGDGLPIEIAVGKVSEMMAGTKSGEFFGLVSQKIVRQGMPVEQAIFDPKRGALLEFPSPLIESSMKVLIESSRKGPMVASAAMINVSQYIKDIHRVDERVKDLMADIISDMKQQVGVLAPAIAGIVVGITSMIITIIGRLSEQLTAISEFSGSSSAAIPAGLLNLFGSGVPTYFFQIIIGLYIIEVTIILTILINGIENGSDKVAERFMLGSNLIKGTVIYGIVAFAITMLFNIIAASIIGGIAQPAV
ncbi:hypothetical protein HYU16_03680 [Candidatus Woesearchaeota archaeon]|nr:hypothetical protein [Candidatus Woesearchaeota archaeon]